mmetsp:Transcript_14830/g.22999  ORF Transcript_14830/g.22999 Transcript_14830/m.22999 type:complete len:103 (-) Transcript_14830:1971-2279(-)
MTEVISRYQVRMDNDKMKSDALAICLGDATCSGLISESKPEIMNQLMEKIFEGYGSMTSSAKLAAKTNSENIYNLAKSNKSEDHMALLENFYVEYLPTKVTE